MAEVGPEHGLVIGDATQHLIDLSQLAPLGIEVLGAREDGHQQDLGSRKFRAELVHDGADAVHDLLRGVVFAVGIVGPDHHHGRLGLETREVAVVETPEDVLGAIATDAQVDGVALGVVLGPDLLALPFPTLRDGVADEDQLRLAPIGSHRGIETRLTIHPPLVGARGRFDGGMGQGGNQAELKAKDERSQAGSGSHGHGKTMRHTPPRARIFLEPVNDR